MDITQNDNGHPSIRTLDRPAFLGILDRLADFMKETKEGPKPDRPPKDVVADMMAAKELPLPILLGIVEAPVFDSSGRLTTRSGYQPETRYYLELPKAQSLRPIPEIPTQYDIDNARAIILEDHLVDFCFVGDSDRAHAVAVMLLPFVRALIDGYTPLHLVESPTPGSAKGLLVHRRRLA